MTLNPYFPVNRFRSVKRSNRVMSWNTWDISTALFPVLHDMYSDETTNTSQKPLETLNFKN